MPDAAHSSLLRATIQWAGLIGGPVLAAVSFALLPEQYIDADGAAVSFTTGGRATMAVMIWMAAWWLTEAIDISATALLPLAVFPLLGVATMTGAAAPYADQLIFLFMGGFLLALSMQRWGLDQRIALITLRLVGTRPANMVAGFMIATGVLSAFVSNTATAAMMMPIALSVIDLVLRRNAETPTAGNAEIGKRRNAEMGSAGVPPVGSAGVPPAAQPVEMSTGQQVNKSTEGQSDNNNNNTEPSPPAPLPGGEGRITAAAPGTPGRNFALCLMLGIAYAASIGGIATVIGTPPNAFLVGFIGSDAMDEPYRTTISFARWMTIGVPLALVFLPLTWLLLTKVIYPIRLREIEGGGALIRDQLRALGPMKPGEWITFIVFCCTALLWITRPIITGGWEKGIDEATGETLWHIPPLAPGLTDAGIAMIAGLILFIIPVNLRTRTFTMNWDAARRLPWGILILFGGGLSLAAAVGANGVAEFLGSLATNVAGMPDILIVLLICAAVIFLTELTSNTATTATLVPILTALAPGLGVHPYLLIVPAALAASCAFMMPVATPPNAIVFGSGFVTIPQMCKAGLWLNIAGIALITLLTFLIAGPALGV